MTMTSLAPTKATAFVRPEVKVSRSSARKLLFGKALACRSTSPDMRMPLERTCAVTTPRTAKLMTPAPELYIPVVGSAVNDQVGAPAVPAGPLSLEPAN